MSAEIPPQPDGTEPLVPRFGKRVGHIVWVELNPTHCHLGHEYVINRQSYVHGTWVGCSCPTASDGGGHRIWVCLTDVGGGRECKDERWLPECSDPGKQAEAHRRG